MYFKLVDAVGHELKMSCAYPGFMAQHNLRGTVIVSIPAVHLVTVDKFFVVVSSNLKGMKNPWGHDNPWLPKSHTAYMLRSGMFFVT